MNRTPIACLVLIVNLVAAPEPMWDLQTSGIKADLNAIHCPNANQCYSVGDSSTILKTTDGGAHWSREGATGAPSLLTSVSFPSPDTGFIVGDSGAVLRTTTGGSSWEKYQWQAASNMPKIKLNSVFCFSSQKCWAVGESVTLRTWDAGTTWKVFSGTTNGIAGGSSLNCLDTSTCFATSGNSGPASGNSILKSVDSGSGWTWHKVAFDSYFGSHSAISFLNKDIGFSAGRTVPDGSGSYGAYDWKISKTVDGGTTWTDVVKTWPKPASAPRFITCSDSNSCILIAGGKDYGNNPVLYSSENGGVDWVEQTGLMTFVHCPDKFTCYAVGESGVILKRTKPLTSLQAPRLVRSNKQTSNARPVVNALGRRVSGNAGVIHFRNGSVSRWGTP